MRDSNKILEELYIRDENNLFSEIDSEIVILNIHDSKYYHLNEVASDIWKILVKPHRVEDIIKSLQEEYDVEGETCYRDTLAYLEELLQFKLIKALDE
jgi:hypothetical protein